MKYTVFGFSQAKLIKLGLDIEDALILRYFIDFKDSGKMSKELFDTDVFYWVKYESIKKELPILNIGKDRIYRKLKKLVDAGILVHQTKKSGGTFSFYGVGKQYSSLITSDNSTVNSTVKIPEGTAKIPEGYGKNTEEGTAKIPGGYGENNGTKYSSIKDPSIKNNSSTKNIYVKVIDYLNLKAKTNYKVTSKKTQQLIQARLNEKFTSDDFKKVIDKKCTEWLGTDFEKFLRPETLFGTKFEGYLNQKSSPKPLNKKNTFCDFEQRSDAAETYRKILENQQLEESKTDDHFMDKLGSKLKEGENQYEKGH